MLLDIPFDILMDEITSRLDIDALKAMRTVCKTLNDAVTLDIIWKPHYQALYALRNSDYKRIIYEEHYSCELNNCPPEQCIEITTKLMDPNAVYVNVPGEGWTTDWFYMGAHSCKRKQHCLDTTHFKPIYATEPMITPVTSNYFEACCRIEKAWNWQQNRRKRSRGAITKATIISKANKNKIGAYARSIANGTSQYYLC